MLGCSCSSKYTGLEIDNEKVENNSIFDNSKKSREFLDSIMKIKSRDYRLIDNVKSILFTDSFDSNDRLSSIHDQLYLNRSLNHVLVIGIVDRFLKHNTKRLNLEQDFTG